MFLSVIIPAFNEEKRIEKTLLQIDAYLSKQKYDSEIIVVNDGSSDETVKVVTKLDIENLWLIDNKINQGKGYAVRQGLLKAHGKYRLFMDADNAAPIQEIEKLLPYLHDYDIVIGSRSVEGAHIKKHQPLYRLVLGKLYRLLVKIIVGLGNIRDTQCGFKILTSEAAENILPKCQIHGWSFDVEMLMLAKKLNYKIKEVPITWTNQSETKVRPLGMICSILDLVQIKWNIITGKYKK